jgi:hypothetical protein
MKERGVDKRGQRIRKSEGLTKNAQTCNIRNTTQVNEKLGKRADYLMFDWVQFMSKEYFGAIDAINECYRKMLEIGKYKEVFQRVNGNQCELLRAKLKQEFLSDKKNILLHYSRYVNSCAPKLTISIDVELAPDPRKYTNSGQEMPTEKEIIVKKQSIKREFVTNNLNIQKCNICLECQMEKDVMMKQDSFTCKKCKDRNDPNHFIKNNMHPLRYEIKDDGSF